MKSLICWGILCALLVFVPVVSATPITLIDTFEQPGYGYGGSGWTLGGDGSTDGQTVAMQFTPLATAPLASVELAVFYSQGANTLLLDLSIDAAGVPGAPLESFTVSGQMVPLSSIISVNSVANPVLSVGTLYWLVAAVPDPSADWSAWNLSAPPVTGTYAFRVGTGAWNVVTDGTLSAFRITGDTEIPEPGSFVLMVIGLAAILVGARRRTRH